MVQQETALHVLNSGVVVDRSVFVKQNADDIANTITAIADTGKPFFVVDDANSFFSIKTMMEALANDQAAKAKLIGEHLLGQDAPAAFEPPKVAPEPVVEPVQAQNAYKWSPVPAGWTVAFYWSLGPTKVKLREGPNISINTDQMPKLWDYARTIWAGGGTNYPMILTSEGISKPVIYPDGVALCGGKLKIERHALEQLAKYRGWQLPA